MGCQLCGFAARTQPSIGLLDPLYAKCLYFEDDGERLLWLHADLIGFDAADVATFRAWAKGELELDPHQVMLSATHTHNGPPTIRLTGCGEYDAGYVQWLLEQLQQAAVEAIANIEPCRLVRAEGRIDLAVDRRGKPSAHTDARVGLLAAQRDNGSYKAALVNHVMHQVALGSQCRQISADVAGQVAAVLREQLDGSPTVLLTNGGAGNINPPQSNVPYAQVQTWGRQIAVCALDALDESVPIEPASLKSARQVAALPLQGMSHTQMQQYAAKGFTHWYETMAERLDEDPQPLCDDVELFAVRLGDVHFVGVAAEAFSRLADDLRDATGRTLYVIGYANGDVGYIPPAAACAEGGYEVDSAFLYYNSFPFRPGGHELLCTQATTMISQLPLS